MQTDIKPVFLILLIVLTAGCTQYQTPTSGTTSTEAYSAIETAQKNYNSVNADILKVVEPYNEAVSKGVETTSSGPLVSELKNKLSNANNLLNLALSNYNSRNYYSAKTYAEQSNSVSQEIKNSLNSVPPALENDYKKTAEKYKPLLTEAERQYKISVKYVETIQKYGVDVTPYQNQLNGLFQTLTSSKDAYKNNNYLGLSIQITSIITTSQNIQKDLTDLYYTALISNSLKKIESNVTSSEAKGYLSQAKNLLQQKKFEDSVNSLNKAILTESQSNIKTNLEIITKYIRNECTIEADFPQIDTRLTSLNSHIKSGNFESANDDIAFLRNEVALIPENAVKVAQAIRAIDDLSKLSFWWASTPDITTPTAKLTAAKQLLMKGDHKSAAVSAQSALDLTNNERNEFWNNVKSDPILGIILSVNKLYSDPEIYSQKSVNALLIPQTMSVELIKIEFGRPIVDITDIDIQEPSIPVIQTITPTSSPITPSKKPVDFALDPGTQTNCGATCRQTTATITNTGDSTAHNVCVLLTVYNSKGEQINLNNGPNIQQCIGDLAGGQSKSESITINAECGLFYTKCIGQTLTLKCQATSNEKTVQFPDRVISV
jgi:hypothetical protein